MAKKVKHTPEHQRRFGAHLSIAGGMYHAIERAAELGCDVVQVFVKNQRQWRAKPLAESDLRAWKAAIESTGIRPVTAHATYLINLGSPDEQMWHKSIDAYTDEMVRCEQLGIVSLVVHPGSPHEQGEAWGLRRIASALDVVHQRTAGFQARTVLEITAGQGSSLGYRFGQLAEIIRQTRRPERCAVCLDTCHMQAGGYELSSDQGYQQTMGELQQQLGLEQVVCIHMNDSLKPCGSRVDRHAAIGKGTIGRPFFRRLVNDSRFFGLPMVLETPKGQDQRGRELDRVNLATLRNLIE